MAPPARYNQKMHVAPFLREAYQLDPPVIRARLLAAGLEDFPPDGVLVFAAALIQGSREGPLLRELGVSDQAAGQILDSLIKRGYLKLPARSDGCDQPTVTVTERGRKVIFAAVSGAMAARLANFSFRPGDIVISTADRSGTTWTQMICALLIFQTPDLPAPLQELSPWIDSQSVSRDEVYSRLAMQRHRRFVKTHLSLRELPIDPPA